MHVAEWEQQGDLSSDLTAWQPWPLAAKTNTGPVESNHINVPQDRHKCRTGASVEKKKTSAPCFLARLLFVPARCPWAKSARETTTNSQVQQDKSNAIFARTSLGGGRRDKFKRLSSDGSRITRAAAASHAPPHREGGGRGHSRSLGVSILVYSRACVRLREGTRTHFLGTRGHAQGRGARRHAAARFKRLSSDGSRITRAAAASHAPPHREGGGRGHSRSLGVSILVYSRACVRLREGTRTHFLGTRGGPRRQMALATPPACRRRAGQTRAHTTAPLGGEGVGARAQRPLTIDARMGPSQSSPAERPPGAPAATSPAARSPPAAHVPAWVSIPPLARPSNPASMLMREGSFFLDL